MALALTIELLALFFIMDTLSSVRSFVGAEGLWSKAQKDATQNLYRYVILKERKHYVAFLEKLQVPLGDRIAREELKKTGPKDIAKVYSNAVNLKPEITPIPQYSNRKKNIILTLMIIWSAFHILFPLRKYLYSGNYSWNMQGHYFSWQMKLNKMESDGVVYNIKDNVTGEFMHDDAGKFVRTSPHTSYHLTRRQMFGIGCRPDFHLQYAKFLKKVWTKETGHDVSV